MLSLVPEGLAGARLQGAADSVLTTQRFDQSRAREFVSVCKSRATPYRTKALSGGASLNQVVNRETKLQHWCGIPGKSTL